MPAITFQRLTELHHFDTSIGVLICTIYQYAIFVHSFPCPEKWGAWYKAPTRGIVFSVKNCECEECPSTSPAHHCGTTRACVSCRACLGFTICASGYVFLTDSAGVEVVPLGLMNWIPTSYPWCYISSSESCFYHIASRCRSQIKSPTGFFLNARMR